VKLRRADRFVVPSEHGAAAAFVASHLYVAHSFRERLAWRFHRAFGGRTLFRAIAPDALADAAQAAIADAADLVPHLAGNATSWIVDTDYADSARHRTVAIVFREGRADPALVVKRARHVPGGGARALHGEREALEMLHRRLPPALVETVPHVIGHSVTEGWESLALTWVQGRSAYADMQTSLLPASGIAVHFRSAGRWLADFHDATAEHGRALQPARDEAAVRDMLALSGSRDDRQWFARLCDWCAAHPVHAVTSHGDFWARNVLLGAPRHAAGVVDWEQSARDASPFDDLFHFAVSYGLAYPWRRYRRASAEDALRRTFLEENRVSSAVRQYLHDYCRGRALDTAALEWWFRLFLLRRAHDGGREGALWIRFEERLARASRSVFSG
jgi:aminoglycoside phosphotransferase (APT) family kinase protein